MRILFVTPGLPNRLNRIRALNILTYLAPRHEVDLLSIIRSDAELEELEHLRPLCRVIETVHLPRWKSLTSCLMHLPTRDPLRVAYYRSSVMRRKLRAMVEEGDYDLLYIKRKRMAQFADDISSVPRVLDLTDAVSLYYKRSLQYVDPMRWPVHWEEYLKISRYERDAVGRFEATVVCSEVDRAFLIDLGAPGERIHVIPNGVDIAYYRPRGNEPEPQSVMFSGYMSKHVNIDGAAYFYHQILPLVRQELPQVGFYVVGPEPPGSIERWSHGDGNITVTGFARDIRDYIELATVVVCPIRIGAGTRNKILQAWAVGRPVVSTPRGAEGLRFVDGKHLLIADDPHEFARATVRLINDPDLRERLIRNGLEHVRQEYSMERIGSTLNDLLERVREHWKGRSSGGN